MLNHDIIETRRARQLTEEAERVAFSVQKLYGLSSQSVTLPLNSSETMESGQVCVTMDPEARHSGNIGLADFARRKLKVTYAVQAVFPGLHELVKTGNYSPELLAPVRLVATDDCTLTPELSGWHAFGCLEFLPGSVWAGAKGG